MAFGSPAATIQETPIACHEEYRVERQSNHRSTERKSTNKRHSPKQIVPRRPRANNVESPALTGQSRIQRQEGPIVSIPPTAVLARHAFRALLLALLMGCMVPVIAGCALGEGLLHALEVTGRAGNGEYIDEPEYYEAPKPLRVYTVEFVKSADQFDLSAPKTTFFYQGEKLVVRLYYYFDGNVTVKLYHTDTYAQAGLQALQPDVPVTVPEELVHTQNLNVQWDLVHSIEYTHQKPGKYRVVVFNGDSTSGIAEAHLSPLTRD